jgi:hypothetical protein
VADPLLGQGGSGSDLDNLECSEGQRGSFHFLIKCCEGAGTCSERDGKMQGIGSAQCLVGAQREQQLFGLAVQIAVELQ